MERAHWAGMLAKLQRQRTGSPHPSPTASTQAALGHCLSIGFPLNPECLCASIHKERREQLVMVGVGQGGGGLERGLGRVNRPEDSQFRQELGTSPPLTSLFPLQQWRDCIR